MTRLAARNLPACPRSRGMISTIHLSPPQEATMSQASVPSPDAPAPVPQRPGGARQWINQNKGIVVVMSIILLTVAGGSVAWRYRPKPPPTPGHAYFYDTVDKKVFEDLSTRVAPFNTASGHVAVRANFFTCGGCGEGERFLGY